MEDSNRRSFAKRYQAWVNLPLVFLLLAGLLLETLKIYDFMHHRWALALLGIALAANGAFLIFFGREIMESYEDRMKNSRAKSPALSRLFLPPTYNSELYW